MRHSGFEHGWWRCDVSSRNPTSAIAFPKHDGRSVRQAGEDDAPSDRLSCPRPAGCGPAPPGCVRGERVEGVGQRPKDGKACTLRPVSANRFPSSASDEDDVPTAKRSIPAELLVEKEPDSARAGHVTIRLPASDIEALLKSERA